MLEYRLGSGATKAESDGDGIADGVEYYTHGTNPATPDTDADGIPDGWELGNGLNPRTQDGDLDYDLDGVTNLQEYQNRGSGYRANLADSLSDGTSDYERLWGNAPERYYYDKADRLVGAEYNHGTRGFSIAYFYDGNGNIKRQAHLTRDGNANGVPDLWETLNGLTNSASAFADSDGDGWSDYQEWKGGSNPLDLGSVPTNAPQTAPITCILPDPSVGSGLATNQIQLWDAEGNSAWLEMQFQVSGSTDWTNITIVSVDESTYGAVSAPPAGLTHQVVWNPGTQLGAGVTTNLLLQARAVDLTLTGAWSAPIEYHVDTGTPPAIQIQPVSATNIVGTTASFIVSATGTAPLAYEWRKNGLPLSGDGRVSGAATASLAVLSVTTNDWGSYMVVITNVAGSVTSAVATLTVDPKALIVSGLTASNKVYDGGTAVSLNMESASLVGVLPQDVGNVSLVTNSAGGSFADKNVGAGKTVTVSGLSLTGSAAGNYTLTQPVLSADITAASSMTVLVSSRNPAPFGSNVAFTATVSGVPPVADSPSGNVVFLVNGFPLSTNALVSGSVNASTASLPVGTNTVAVEYAGDGNFLPSSTSLQQVVYLLTCSQTNSVAGITRNVDGTLTLTFLGTPGAQYCVVWQTNAAEPVANWDVLVDSTNTVTDSGGLWSITVTNEGESRFYRSKALSVCSTLSAGLVAVLPVRWKRE